MIQFNDIKINTQADTLSIDVEIIPDEAFSKCYLKKIYIDTQDSYLTSGPSEDVVYTKEIDKGDIDYNIPGSYVEIDDDKKVRKLKIDIPQIEIKANLASNFFIVYVEADGIISDTNVNFCETDYMGVGCVFHMRKVYQGFISWIREIANSCEIPKNFIYSYLQYQALLTSVRTGNMMEAIKIYNKYIKNIQGVGGNINGCSCRR